MTAVAGTSKNLALIWSRDQVGWTQAEAADQLGCHRVTFAQWEAGVRAMPERKWRRFQELVKQANPMAVMKCPAAREYNPDTGYPVGFDRTPFAETDDYDAEDAALAALEGAEFPARERERARIANTSHMRADDARQWMAEDDDEQRRLAAGMPARSYAEIHHGETERQRSNTTRWMLAWKQDPEGMATRLRTVAARWPLTWENPAELEAHIHDLQTRANLWPSPTSHSGPAADLV